MIVQTTDITWPTRHALLLTVCDLLPPGSAENSEVTAAACGGCQEKQGGNLGPRGDSLVEVMNYRLSPAVKMEGRKRNWYHSFTAGSNHTSLPLPAVTH